MIPKIGDSITWTEDSEGMVLPELQDGPVTEKRGIVTELLDDRVIVDDRWEILHEAITSIKKED